MKTIGYSLVILLVWACSDIQNDRTAAINIKTAPAQVEVFLPDVISTDLYERDIAISRSGDFIVYTLGDIKQSRRCLVSIQRKNGEWQHPEIMPFSGRYQDIEPFLSADGNRLYFASNRPNKYFPGADDYNLWYADRAGNSWSEPVMLDTIINTVGDEFYPSLSDNGNLYFTATRGDGVGREDIFMAPYHNGTYQKPSVLDSSINTQVYEFNAFISPDETTLIFSSYGRKDGLGGGDLYISKRQEDGSWSMSRNMGQGINSTSLDYCPFVDFEHRVLYFTSDRAEPEDKTYSDISEFKNEARRVMNGFGNIFHVHLDSVGM